MGDDFGRELVALLPNMRRFALSLCRSRDLAEDLVQAACERALAARGSYAPGTRMDSWLFRILRNLWIDRLRKARGEGTIVDVDDLAETAPGSDGLEPERRLMLDATAKTLLALPADQREVMVLVCVEDLSYREAAEILDVPIGTVMSRLARARRRLAQTLGIDAPEGRSPAREDGTP